MLSLSVAVPEPLLCRAVSSSAETSPEHETDASGHQLQGPADGPS